jgi:hypothetical protein
MDVFIVKVEYHTALLVPKIERAITKHGEIVSQTYLNAPDKNGYWTPCTATYVVITKDPRVLKITLTQLQNRHKSTITCLQTP